MPFVPPPRYRSLAVGCALLTEGVTAASTSAWRNFSDHGCGMIDLVFAAVLVHMPYEDL